MTVILIWLFFRPLMFRDAPTFLAKIMHNNNCLRSSPQITMERHVAHLKDSSYPSACFRFHVSLGKGPSDFAQYIGNWACT